MEQEQKKGLIQGPIMMYIVMFLAYALVNFHRYATSMTASMLAEDMALTAAQVTAYIGAYTWTNAIMQLPAGIICDKYGARKLLTICYAISAIGLLLIAYSGSFAGIVIGRIILTIGIRRLYSMQRYDVSRC